MANEGPLTRADFEALFRSVNDPSYVEPFLELGEGRGYEAHVQGFEQFADVSEAVDATMGAFYVLPFSGQTAPSATGGKKSSVLLTFVRSAAAPISASVPVFLPGNLTVAEVALDMGPTGGVEVETGRRYVAGPAFGLGSGDSGPVEATFFAERVGATYDRADLGAVSFLVEQGAGLSNDGASVVPGSAVHKLVLDATPDVVSAAQVGMSIVLEKGANAGRICRIAGYRDPSDSPPTGGTVLLGADGAYRLATFAGQFHPGETLVEQVTGTTATVVFHDGGTLVAQRGQAGTSLVVGNLWVGVSSGAVAVADAVDASPDLATESGTAGWRVLAWSTDFGISVSNALAPEGGTSATLDELGSEVDVGRAPGEDDASYAERVAAAPDLVTPGAIVRAANRILARYGQSADLLEVGSPSFSGAYADGDPTSGDPSVAFAYDMDATSRGGADREKVDLSLLESRAFFLLRVPDFGLGDFGVAYDAGASNAYDAAPWLCFTDGFPATAAGIYRAVWQAAYRTRAGGVGFDLELAT